MRIKALSPPTGGKKLWKLQLEDGSSLSIGEEELLTFSPCSGMELTEEELARLSRASARAVLRQRAMNILLYRPHSRGELTRKLAEKQDDESLIEDICDWAARIGLLDDGALAKTLVRRYQERGYGLYKIKNELYRHQIPRELWDGALAELEPGDGAIDRYLERHLKSTEPKALKKAADALARRGFSWSEISAGLRRFGAEE